MCTPQGGKKLWAKFTGEICKCTQAESAPPEAEQESIFEETGGDLGSGRGYLGSFSVCFDSYDWKKVVNFFFGGGVEE